MSRTFERRTRIADSEIMVPVDIQGSYIQVPVDIQGQAIDVTVVPKYNESSATATSIDAETIVLDLDVRQYKKMGISLSNTGANSLDYTIVGLSLYGGSIENTLVAYTSLAAGATAHHDLDVSGYSRILVKAKATTAGSPSDIYIEYIIKG